MGKLIITPLAGGILTAFHDGGRLRQLDWNKMDEEPRCGDIYRAKISSVNRNIQAAFAGLGGQNGYLQLGENDKIKTGDELTLQVSKEAVKTKLPVMTRQLSFPGKYLVFLPGGRGLHLSHKLEQNAVPEQLTKVASERLEGQDIILPFQAPDGEILLRGQTETTAAGSGFSIEDGHPGIGFADLPADLPGGLHGDETFGNQVLRQQ